MREIKKRLPFAKRKLEDVELTKEDADKLFENTKMLNIRQWMKNFRDNFEDVVDGRDFREMKDEKKGSCLCVGGGPSIELHNHLDILERSDYGGTIITTDRRLEGLLEHGTVPDWVVCCEGNPSILHFFDNELVEKHSHDMKALFATTCPRCVTEKWKGEKYWFNAVIDNPNDPLGITACMHYMTKNTICDSLGNVGSLAIVLGMKFNKNPIALIGYDMSFVTDDPKETEIYWHYHNIGTLSEKEIQENFKRIYVPEMGREFMTETSLLVYAKLLKRILPATQTNPYFLDGKRRELAEFINCSEWGLLYGPPFRRMKLEEFLER